MSKINGDQVQSAQMRVTVVIPTVYKQNLDDLRSAIISLLQHTPGTVRVSFLIFIDRADISFDPKRYITELKVPKASLTCLWSHTPVGFTGAINQSLQVAHRKNKSDWFLIFNDDALATRNFWQLSKLLYAQKMGVVSCAVKTTSNTIDSNGLSTTKWGVTLPIQHLSKTKFQQSQLFAGTCFFVHKATVQHLFNQFGFFFYPLFFAYAEDFELSIRLSRMKVPVQIDSTVRVIHKGSSTAGRGSYFQLFHGLRNDAWVHLLHHQSNLSLLWYGMRYGVYLCLLAFYKGYWFLPARVVGSTLKNFKTLWYWRTLYDQKLSNHYSF